MTNASEHGNRRNVRPRVWKYELCERNVNSHHEPKQQCGVRLRVHEREVPKSGHK